MKSNTKATIGYKETKVMLDKAFKLIEERGCYVQYNDPPLPPSTPPQDLSLFRKVLTRLRQGDLTPLIALGVGAVLAIALQLLFARASSPAAVANSAPEKEATKRPRKTRKVA